MTADDSFELDFYICADRNSPAVQEIKKILREAGYSVYLPIRTKVEPELERVAEERFKTIALVLTRDREQARMDLEELLIILSIRDDAPEVIIFQFERNELAALIDAKFIVDLVGLHNSKDRKARVLAAFERDALSSDAIEEFLLGGADTADCARFTPQRFVSGRVSSEVGKNASLFKKTCRPT